MRSLEANSISFACFFSAQAHQHLLRTPSISQTLIHAPVSACVLQLARTKGELSVAPLSVVR